MMAWPDRLVPAARKVTGTPCFLAMGRMRLTSCVGRAPPRERVREGSAGCVLLLLWWWCVCVGGGGWNTCSRRWPCHSSAMAHGGSNLRGCLPLACWAASGAGSARQEARRARGVPALLFFVGSHLLGVNLDHHLRVQAVKAGICAIAEGAHRVRVLALLGDEGRDLLCAREGVGEGRGGVGWGGGRGGGGARAASWPGPAVPAGGWRPNHPRAQGPCAPGCGWGEGAGAALGGCRHGGLAAWLPTACGAG